MHNGVAAPPPPRLRRLHHRHKAVDLPDPCPSSPELAGSASSLGRDVATSLKRYHRAMGRNTHALQPLSPASYGTSVEMGPYNPAETPTSSVDFKGRNGDTGHGLKTSTELIKVLNRIWSLEEQHTSNVSQVKEMRRELDYSRTRIKELLRLQQADRHEIEDLRNQIAEDKLLRKNKEHDRIIAAVQSVRNELEDERKLRKRSESLHRKLAGELSEVKRFLACSLQDLDRERKSRSLLEDLCDEFARGIKSYEQEVHVMKQKTGVDWSDRTDQTRLILHLSESWLDHRVQMKLGEKEKNAVVDNFCSEIENFLQASNRRTSLESIPLNTIVSAPRDVGDEEDSDSHCFELTKPSSSSLKQGEDENGHDHAQDTEKPGFASSEKAKAQSPTSFQMKFEEQMARAILINDKQNLSGTSKSEICEVTLEGGGHATAASSGNPPWRGLASPMRQWTARLPSQDLDIVKSSSNLSPPPPDVRDNTLKAKLLEARARGQRSRSRLKASKNAL